MSRVLEYFKAIDYTIAYIVMDTEYCKAVFAKMYEKRYLMIPFIQRSLKGLVRSNTPEWILQFIEMGEDDIQSTAEENSLYVIFNILNYVALEIQADDVLSAEERFNLTIRIARALIFFCEIVSTTGKFPESEKGKLVRFSQKLALTYPESCNYIYDLTSDLLHLSMVLSALETDIFGGNMQ